MKHIEPLDTADILGVTRDLKPLKSDEITALIWSLAGHVQRLQAELSSMKDQMKRVKKRGIFWLTTRPN